MGPRSQDATAEAEDITMVVLDGVQHEGDRHVISIARNAIDARGVQACCRGQGGGIDFLGKADPQAVVDGIQREGRRRFIALQGEAAGEGTGVAGAGAVVGRGNVTFGAWLHRHLHCPALAGEQEAGMDGGAGDRGIVGVETGALERAGGRSHDGVEVFAAVVSTLGGHVGRGRGGAVEKVAGEGDQVAGGNRRRGGIAHHGFDEPRAPQPLAGVAGEITAAAFAGEGAGNGAVDPVAGAVRDGIARAFLERILGDQTRRARRRRGAHAGQQLGLGAGDVPNTEFIDRAGEAAGVAGADDEIPRPGHTGDVGRIRLGRQPAIEIPADLLRRDVKVPDHGHVGPFADPEGGGGVHLLVVRAVSAVRAIVVVDVPAVLDGHGALATVGLFEGVLPHAEPVRTDPELDRLTAGDLEGRRAAEIDVIAIAGEAQVLAGGAGDRHLHPVAAGRADGVAQRGTGHHGLGRGVAIAPQGELQAGKVERRGGWGLEGEVDVRPAGQRAEIDPVRAAIEDARGVQGEAAAGGRGGIAVGGRGQIVGLRFLLETPAQEHLGLEGRGGAVRVEVQRIDAGRGDREVLQQGPPARVAGDGDKVRPSGIGQADDRGCAGLALGFHADRQAIARHGVEDALDAVGGAGGDVVAGEIVDEESAAGGRLDKFKEGLRLQPAEDR
ncbi:hypothetical protein Hsar01_03744 [Haloferula sargassicola]|uniref:Uncharacterized protein n=1 Tax=Haloferula sargassicola TaxID=490096 RepID=A0ABP9USI8_9BACT